MAPELVSIAYRHEYGIPWHRSGTPMYGKVTAREAALAAAMDYEIRKVELSAELDNLIIKSPSCDLYSNHGGEWTYLNTIKKAEKYEIVQNMEIADLLDSGTGDKPALTDVFEMDTAGVLSEGKRTFFSLRMGEDTVKIGVDGDDHYVTNMLIFNDFGGNGTLRVAMAATRVVCLNTAIAALEEAEKDDKLWSFPHRSQPLERLAFRIELEKTFQSARSNYYKELQAMVDVKFTEADRDQFVLALYPDPSLPKVIKQASYANTEMREAIVVPMQSAAANAQAVHDTGVERAERTRKALTERINEYEDTYSDRSLYWSYNGATDFINWYKERGTWADAGESVMFNTGYKDLQRLTEVSRQALNPNYKPRRNKKSLVSAS